MNPTENTIETMLVADIRKAAAKGDAVEMARLIPLSDPTYMFNAALRLAAFNGHVECVQLLIPVSDPKAMNSAALQYAAEEGHRECVDLLFDVSDPTTALHYLQQDYPDDYTKWGQLHEMVEVERLNTTLHKEIQNTKSIKNKSLRKM